MGELILRKVLSCRSRIEKVRRALPTVPEDILRDETVEAFVSFNLLLLVQDALDIAARLIAERGLGVPASQRESFRILAAAGILTDETAVEMGQLASLRNRIAHAYGDLDPVRMVRETPRGLAVAGRFLDELVLRAGV